MELEISQALVYTVAYRYLPIVKNVMPVKSAFFVELWFLSRFFLKVNYQKNSLVFFLKWT
jgi:hypothetical protein